MSLGQKIVYLLKPFALSKTGNFLRDCTKTAAGAVFDLLYKDYRTGGCVFTIPRSHTTRQMRSRFLLDTYELPERTLIKGHLPPDACVLEMGASLGIVSCFINRSLSDRSRHVAIEVNTELLPVIEANRVRNGCEFAIENCAITGQKSMFFQRMQDSDGGRISRGNGVPIATRNLSDVEISHGLSFDTIVMDVEGAEIAFLAEYEAILPRINTIIVEFHPWIVSQTEIEKARGRLLGAGLRSVGKMLDVEAFSRVRDSSMALPASLA